MLLFLQHTPRKDEKNTLFRLIIEICKQVPLMLFDGSREGTKQCSQINNMITEYVRLNASLTCGANKPFASTKLNLVKSQDLIHRPVCEMIKSKTFVRQVMSVVTQQSKISLAGAARLREDNTWDRPDEDGKESSPLPGRSLKCSNTSNNEVNEKNNSFHFKAI